MLDKCPLFSNLTRDDIAKITLIASLRKYSKGETIFFENTTADRFFIVSNGRVKIYKVSKGGREQVLGIFGERSTIGEAAIFSGSHYPANAEALSDCGLYTIRRGDFVSLLKTNPEISMRMIGVLSNRLIYLNRLIEDLSLKDVQTRVAKFLLDYSIKKNKDSFRLEVRKQDLAHRLGTVGETLSRTLRRFKEKKIIDIKGKEISILNKLLLQKMLSGEKC